MGTSRRERFLDYLLQIENLDTVTECLRPNDSIVFIGFYFTPDYWNTMLWKTANIIESTLFLTKDRDIVPPTLANDFSKCCAVSLAYNSKFTALKSNAPNRTTWKLRYLSNLGSSGNRCPFNAWENYQSFRCYL